MTTGERIKHRRKDLGLSADYLAEKLGVSRSTIFRYENGDIEKLPADALEPIAFYLHTSAAYLMGWEDDAEKQPRRAVELSKNEKKILDMFRQFPDSDQEMILQMIEAALRSRGTLK